MIKLQKKLLSKTINVVFDLAIIELLLPTTTNTFVIFNQTGNMLGGGSRWDSISRIINGNERSLEGGLRYSLQGGSYQAYRDLFSWYVVLSVANFQ